MNTADTWTKNAHGVTASKVMSTIASCPSEANYFNNSNKKCKMTPCIAMKCETGGKGFILFRNKYLLLDLDTPNIRHDAAD